MLVELEPLLAAVSDVDSVVVDPAGELLAGGGALAGVGLAAAAGVVEPTCVGLPAPISIIVLVFVVGPHPKCSPGPTVGSRIHHRCKRV